MKHWALALSLFLSHAAAAQDAPPPAELLHTANASMRAAIEGPDSRRDLELRRALAAYETLYREHDRSSAALHVAAGNAALLLNDAASAVTHYRRALRHDPTDRAARQGLVASRAIVRTSIDPTPAERFARLALAWRRWVAPRWIFVATLVAFAACCATWCARTLLRWRLPRWPTAVVAAAGAALLLTDAGVNARPVGVVKSGAAMVRTGPGEALYPPAFTEAPKPGVEFRVLERRDGWIRASFGGAGEAWIRARDVELV